MAKTIYSIKTPDGNPVRCEEAWKDSDGNLLNKKVTTDTEQTITGAKTFSSQITASGGVKTDKVTSTDGTEVLSYDGTTTALKGKADRPTYNGGDLALKSDVSAVSDIFIYVQKANWNTEFFRNKNAAFIPYSGHNLYFYDNGIMTNGYMAFWDAFDSSLNEFHFKGGKNITNADGMFAGLDTRIYIDFDGTSCKNYSRIFREMAQPVMLSLTNMPENSICSQMFYDVDWNTVPAIDLSNASNLDQAFDKSQFITSVLCTGMKVSFSLSDCIIMEQAALRVVIDNLADVSELGTSPTLTLGSTLLAKLTADDITTANNKGWNLA